jgi:hypothetical protein
MEGDEAKSDYEIRDLPRGRDEFRSIQFKTGLAYISAWLCFMIVWFGGQDNSRSRRSARDINGMATPGGDVLQQEAEIIACSMSLLCST